MSECPIFARVNNAGGHIEVRHQVPVCPADMNGCRWIADIHPAHDAATHRLEEALPIPAEATEVPYNIIERDLPAEQAAQQQNQDENYVEFNAKQNAMYVLVELVAKLSADGTIDINDFTAEAKQSYLGLKERVDRLTVS